MDVYSNMHSDLAHSESTSNLVDIRCPIYTSSTMGRNSQIVEIYI